MTYTERPYSLALLVLSLSLLTACTSPTLTLEQCQFGAWRDLGYQDGLQGHGVTRTTKHQEACNKHGLGVNYTEYNQGHADGIKIYCDNQNHYQNGAGGNPFNQVCGTAYLADYQSGLNQYCTRTQPFELGIRNGNYHNVCDTDFTHAYKFGRNISRHRSLVRSYEDDLKDLKRDLRRERDKDKEQRDQNRISDLRDDIDDAEDILDDERRNLLNLALKARGRGYIDDTSLILDVIDLR